MRERLAETNPRNVVQMVMTPSFRRWLSLIIGSLCLGNLARAEEVNEVIARARAYLAPEAVLDAVTSVHYQGTLTGDQDQQKVQIEIIFQKPYRQRIIATSEDKVETTALDDYEGWQRVADPKDPSRWRMTLLKKEMLIRLRVNTWENLSFYRGIERKGGEIEDLGTVTFEGKPVRKLAFNHDHGIQFTRYFDVATGRLLMSETEQGGTIREEGELMAGGIRFPKKIITTNKMADGVTRSVTIVFDSVTVNETFPNETFAVPTVPVGQVSSATGKSAADTSKGAPASR